MIHTLDPARYYDMVYGSGLHVVLLHLDDDLFQSALGPFGRVADQLSRRHVRTFYTCHVQSPQHAADLQVCRFPQYRWFLNGSEQLSHVGVLGDDELFHCIDKADP